jgi:hypothetical protein
MRAVLVLAVAGCWHDAPPPQAPVEPQPAPTETPYFSRAPSGLECTTVMQSVVEKYDPTNSGLQGLRPVLLQVGIASCQEDSWPQELLECFRDADGEKDIQACAERMSQDQRHKFEERFRVALQSSNWPGPGGGSATP